MWLQEQDVSQIWADVIGIPEADVDTNFFDLGGHSLLLMKLVDELNRRLSVDADVVMVIENPTVAEFTSYYNSVEAPVDGSR